MSTIPARRIGRAALVLGLAAGLGACAAPTEVFALPAAPCVAAPAAPHAGAIIAPVPGSSATPAAAECAHPPAGPAGEHNGAIIAPPSSTPAPQPTAAGPDNALTTLAAATVIRSHSVTATVAVPAGLPVPNVTEISVAFGLGHRESFNYNPSSGNLFEFQFDPGDGTPRSEQVAVSFQEHAPAGALTDNVVVNVPIEAVYDVTVSPLQFTLINDCDFDFAGIVPQDSEPSIEWRDVHGNGGFGEASMRGGQQHTFTGFAQTLTGITAKNGYVAPAVLWMEEDDELTVAPNHDSLPPPAPLLPGVTHTVSGQGHAVDDEFCNGSWTYTVTETLETNPVL